MSAKNYILLTGILFSVSSVIADDLSEEKCLLAEIARSDAQTRVDQVRLFCQRGDSSGSEVLDTDKSLDGVSDDSLLTQRIKREKTLANNRNSITPHKRNYFLPITYVDEPNEAPFRGADGGLSDEDQLDNQEAKFQFSLKVPLFSSVIMDDDNINFAFTLTSFWQVYNDEISAPFRETNYEPELYWVTPLSINPFNADSSLFAVGLSHQSNGRNVPLSRSWNRVYISTVWEKDNWVFSFKPWWRIPEDDKDDPLSTDGDDNPDIDDYMGSFEFRTAYRRNHQEFGLMFRNNLRSDNHGALELSWSFPLYGKLRAYVQYFNGYGESLIDYDASVERLGMGILLTDLL